MQVEEIDLSVWLYVVYIHTYSWLMGGLLVVNDGVFVCLPPCCREGEFFLGKEHCCLVQIMQAGVQEDCL